MRVPRWLLASLQRWADRMQYSRAPDFVIGPPEDPYLLRWWVIPRNRWFNVYLHRIRRSDDDRALHDHPWVNASIIVRGGYAEHQIRAGGIHRRSLRCAGSLTLRGPRAAHRLEVVPGIGETVSLFITGPTVRHWGFHCAKGWRHWKDFTAPAERGQIGRGCGELDSPARRGGLLLPFTRKPLERPE